MELKCKLNYNNKLYGKGKAYIAKITGEDSKYKLKRNFLDRETDYDKSSGTTWYKYIWSIKETGIYEFKEENAFKHEVEYFKYDEELNVKQLLTYEEVLRSFASDIKNTEEYKKALEKAKMTGEKQLLSSGMKACNDPAEECSWDSVNKYVLADGNIKTVRCHTY